MTAKPAGEPRPHWTLEDFDDATMTVVELREDGRFRAHVLRDAAERIVAALNAAETRAAQPPFVGDDWGNLVCAKCGAVAQPPLHEADRTREYERDYILPMFDWAKEVGIDLQQMVLDNHGKNCAWLLVHELIHRIRAAQPGDAPKLTGEYPWSLETMALINKLTPDIKGKAFDPDWFLLRNRLEQFEANALLASRSTPAAPAPASTEAPVDAPYCLRCRADNCDHGNCSDWTCALSCEICNKDMPKVESNRLPRVVYAIPSGEGNFLVWIGSDRQEAERMADASRTIIEYHRPPSTEAPGAPDEIVRKLLGDSKLLARGEFNADGTFAAPAATPPDGLEFRRIGSHTGEFSAPAPASTEALIAAGDALRKLIRRWRLWAQADSNPTSAKAIEKCADELAAVATLHPASEETKP